jgi:hypothetical protein
MDIQPSTTRVGQALQRAAIETRYQATRQLEQAVRPALGADQVELSRGGLELSRLRQRLLDEAAQLPEVREDRVALARERVASGFYGAEGIVDQISRRLEEGPVRQAADAGDAAMPPDDYRTELMKEVSAKIESGFYSDQDVMSFVADRLLDIYNITPEEEA